MSNALVNLQDRPSFLAKAPAAAEFAQEFLGGVQTGMALPVLSTRGKEFRLRFQGQEHNTRSRDLEVIIVAARPGVSKRFYDKGYESGEAEAPTCSSADGVTPDEANPISPSCATCPKNVWGSDNRGRGKACSDYKRLVVLPFIDGKLSEQPVVLDVSATALRTPKGYKGTEQFLREYFSALVRHDLPPQGVVTRLGFTDAEYPQLHFAYARYAQQSEYEHAMSLREHADVLSVLEAGQFEAPGPITPAGTPVAAPAPAPAPAPEKPKTSPLPAPVFMWDDEREQGAKVTTEEELAAWKQKGAEEVTERMYQRLTGASATSAGDSSTATEEAATTVAEPAAPVTPPPAAEMIDAEGEAAFAEKPDEDASDEDVMKEIQALLGGLS